MLSSLDILLVGFYTCRVHLLTDTVLQEGVQQLVLGLYIIRGDNIGVVGEVDEELDAALDMSKLRAQPLKPVIH